MRRWRKYAQDISDSEPKMIIFGRLIWLKVGKKLIVNIWAVRLEQFQFLGFFLSFWLGSIGRERYIYIYSYSFPLKCAAGLS